MRFHSFIVDLNRYNNLLCLAHICMHYADIELYKRPQAISSLHIMIPINTTQLTIYSICEEYSPVLVFNLIGALINLFYCIIARS